MRTLVGKASSGCFPEGMSPLRLPLALLIPALFAVPASAALHCTSCADHSEWPALTGSIKRAAGTVTYVGTVRNDELMGHHGSDVLRGGKGSDVLWGDYDPYGQPAWQHDRMYGGRGTDFIYGSHGRNTIYAGPGNDVVSVHYGRGLVDCGPGRDIYHVSRSRRRHYRFRHCEKVDYRPESVRGHGLRPLK